MLKLHVEDLSTSSTAEAKMLNECWILNSHRTGRGEALQKMPVEDSSAMFAQQHNSQNMAPQLWDQPEKKRRVKVSD